MFGEPDSALAKREVLEMGVLKIRGTLEGVIGGYIGCTV